MGRRPVTPSVGFVNQFRQQRMAPGGRRWSESPIPDPAYRRPRARSGGLSAVAPSYFSYAQDASWSSSGRYAPTVDTLAYTATPEGFVAGDMLAVVMLTQGAASPPSGWRMLHSHNYTDHRYYVAVVDSWSPSVSGEWSIDWTGVSGLGEWAYQLLHFSGPEGYTWDVDAADNVGVSGAWQGLPSWGYAVPVPVNSNCEFDYSYGANSYGVEPWHRGIGDTNCWLWFLEPSTVNDPAAYVPGWVDPAEGNPWQPDQPYVCIGEPWYPPSAGNSTLYIGLR